MILISRKVYVGEQGGNTKLGTHGGDLKKTRIRDMKKNASILVFKMI